MSSINNFPDFKINSDLDRAVVSFIKQEGRLPANPVGKKRFCHLIRNSGSCLLVSKIVKIVKGGMSLQWNVYDFQQTCTTFQSVPQKESDFIKKIQELPVVQVEANITNQELVQKIRRAVTARLEVESSLKKMSLCLKKGHAFFLLLVSDIQIEKPVYGFVNQIYTYDEAKSELANPPRTRQAFTQGLLRFPKIDFSTPSKAVEKKRKVIIRIPVTQERVKSVVTSGVEYHFSQELQKGIQGLRGEDHRVSVEMIQKCIQKKAKQISRKIRKEPHQEHEFDFYFLDEKKEAILNLVIKYFLNAQSKAGAAICKVLTSYYPADNVIKQRKRFSDVRFQNWINKLPKA